MRIIYRIGNEALLNREKSLFLCSKHAPYSLYGKVFGWVDSLTVDDCVICFNSSELEDEEAHGVWNGVYLMRMVKVAQNM